MTRPIRFFVFDVTGTLMVPDPEPAAAYLTIGRRHLAEGMDRDVTLELMRDRIVAAMRRHFSDAACTAPTNEVMERCRWRAIMDDCLVEWSKRERDDAFEELWEHFASSEQWQIYPDVEPTITRLRELGFKTACASNFDGRLRTIFSGFGVEHWFDEILISSELGWCKPNLKFYQQAGQRLGISDGSQAFMIGDTKRGDVDAAIQAGWRARLLNRTEPNALSHLVSNVLAQW